MEKLSSFIRDTANKQVLIFTLLLKRDPQLAEFFVEALTEFSQHPELQTHTREAAHDLLQIAQSCLKTTPSSTHQQPARKDRPAWLQCVIEDGRLLNDDE